MKAKIDQWSIVTTGQWNPHIFSAEWVTKNLLEQDEGEIQIQVGFSRGFPVQLRLITERFTLVPAQDRIVFHPSTGSMKNLNALEAVALKTLDTLPHTPVTGYGINFHFYDDLCGDFDHNVFNADDYAKFGNLEFETLERKVFRKVKIDEKTILNLTLVSMENGGIDIDLNFHRSISANDRIAELKGELAGVIGSRYKTSLDILKNVYNLELDIEGSEDD